MPGDYRSALIMVYHFFIRYGMVSGVCAIFGCIFTLRDPADLLSEVPERYDVHI